MNVWNMTIACELRWGVALIGNFSIGRGSLFMGKHLRYRVYIGGRRSFEAAIVKKDNMWL